MLVHAVLCLDSDSEDENTDPAKEAALPKSAPQTVKREAGGVKKEPQAEATPGATPAG